MKFISFCGITIEYTSKVVSGLRLYIEGFVIQGRSDILLTIVTLHGNFDICIQDDPDKITWIKGNLKSCSPSESKKDQYQLTFDWTGPIVFLKPNGVVKTSDAGQIGTKQWEEQFKGEMREWKERTPWQEPIIDYPITYLKWEETEETEIKLKNVFKPLLPIVNKPLVFKPPEVKEIPDAFKNIKALINKGLL